MLIRIAAGIALVAGATAAAILLNLALLGYAQPVNDPVGKLSPRAVFAPGLAPQPGADIPAPDEPSDHDD